MLPFLVIAGLFALAVYKFGDEAREAALPYAPAALGVMPVAADERLRVRPADGVGAGQAGPGVLFLLSITDGTLGAVQVEVSFSGKAARVVSAPDLKLAPYVGQTYLVG